MDINYFINDQINNLEILNEEDKKIVEENIFCINSLWLNYETEKYFVIFRLNDFHVKEKIFFIHFLSTPDNAITDLFLFDKINDKNLYDNIIKIFNNYSIYKGSIEYIDNSIENFEEFKKFNEINNETYIYSCSQNKLRKKINSINDKLMNISFDFEYFISEIKKLIKYVGFNEKSMNCSSMIITNIFLTIWNRVEKNLRHITDIQKNKKSIKQYQSNELIATYKEYKSIVSEITFF